MAFDTPTWRNAALMAQWTCWVGRDVTLVRETELRNPRSAEGGGFRRCMTAVATIQQHTPTSSYGRAVYHSDSLGQHSKRLISSRFAGAQRASGR